MPKIYATDGGFLESAMQFMTPPNATELNAFKARGGLNPDVPANRASNGKPRTRPLCPYPQQARYGGSGDINDASNFACR